MNSFFGADLDEGEAMFDVRTDLRGEENIVMGSVDVRDCGRREKVRRTSEMTTFPCLTIFLNSPSSLASATKYAAGSTSTSFILRSSLSLLLPTTAKLKPAWVLR